MTLGSNYYLRVKTVDLFGAESAWVNFGLLSNNINPTAPTFTDIATDGSGYTINTRPKVKLKVEDPDNNSITDIEMQWDDVSNAFSNIKFTAQYSLNTGGTFSNMPAPSGGFVTFSPTFDLTPKLWNLRVRIKDANGGWSDWSVMKYTIGTNTLTDNIPDDAYGLKAIWLNTLADIINASRQFRGLPLYTFTDGILDNTKDKKAIHITERRAALAEATAKIGITPKYTIESTVDISGTHISEMLLYCYTI
jgi:hypothetical protein